MTEPINTQGSSLNNMAEPTYQQDRQQNLKLIPHFTTRTEKDTTEDRRRINCNRTLCAFRFKGLVFVSYSTKTTFT
jgi:hypothetical protein